MQKIKSVLFTLFLMYSITVAAQKTAVLNYNTIDFDAAVALCSQNQFVAAQSVFENIKRQRTDQSTQMECTYYIAYCAIKLNQVNAEELMDHFIADFPTSTKQNIAFFVFANYYFEKENYTKAILYFDKMDVSNFSIEELEKINFQKGYSFFSLNNKKEATIYFNKVLNSNIFESQANYYLGFMAYEKDDYTEANKKFEEVADSEKYKDKLSYFQADLNFKLGNFKKAIELGTVAVTKSNPSEQSELNKIIGESYFNLYEYEKSLLFLKLYQGKAGKWSTADFYQLGYAYYKQNDFENAISQFNKIVNGSDYIAQNAFYHLGESYLKLEKKQEALNAFKDASEMNFDKKIEEDALLNYAKLSYDIGNSYKSTPEILNSFLVKYPSSLAKIEVEILLINSYVASKNYKEALIILDKNESSTSNAIFQKVAFLYGLELFTDGNYNEAKELFSKSLLRALDKNLVACANFWRGETEFALNNYESAIISYKNTEINANNLINIEFINNNYNLAYCYFKIKQFDVAATFFQKQIVQNTNDKVRLNDSYLRLGDCQFVTSKYALGLESYNKAMAMNGIDNDYAHFQKAISYGFIGKNDKKIEELNNFLKKNLASQYTDDVLFELANTYVSENKLDLALKTYDKLIADFKNGLFTSKSLLKQGLIYYNDQNDALALLKFKKVANDYPGAPESLEAVATARLIYVDNAKVDEYAEWVKSLGYIAVSEVELDNDFFAAADKYYLQGNSSQAITSLASYISKFPNGLHSLKANFYLGQLYFQQDLESASILNYDYVISKAKNEFTEQALSRLCSIYLKTSDFLKAIPVLRRLEEEGDFPQNSAYAQANLMRVYYEIKEYSNAVIYAEKVLSNSKIDPKINSDAQIIIARSAFNSDDNVKAKLAYANLATIAKGGVAAEALFYDAYFKNRENKFAESNSVVQKMAKEYSSYKYFGAKGLLVMAKNYYQLKDAFQATSILESIIENFTNFDDVVQQAKLELEIIKIEESKSNSSIIK